MPKTASSKARFSKLCLALPEVADEVIGQHLAFSVRGKKFAYFLVDHHGDDRVSVQCKGAPGENRALVTGDPVRFFMPPYMAHRGWIGLYVDVGAIDWREIEELVTEAYLLTAPKRLAAQIQAGA